MQSSRRKPFQFIIWPTLQSLSSEMLSDSGSLRYPSSWSLTLWPSSLNFQLCSKGTLIEKMPSPSLYVGHQVSNTQIVTIIFHLHVPRFAPLGSANTISLILKKIVYLQYSKCRNVIASDLTVKHARCTWTRKLMAAWPGTIMSTLQYWIFKTG